MKATSLDYDALRGVVQRLPDNGLAGAREAALSHFGKHGLPTLRDEDWKYTDLTPLVGASPLARALLRRAIRAWSQGF